MLRKILEKVLITKKFTQCKESRTLKIDAFEIPDKMKMLKNCFQNMNCFSWIKLIPALMHLKYWYYSSPYLELSSPFLSNLTLVNWNPSLTKSSSRSPSLSLLCTTLLDHMSPQILDMPNRVPSQASQIYYPAVYRS